MPTGIYQSPNRKGGVKGKSGVYLKSVEHRKKIGETLKRKVANGFKPNTTGIANYWLGKKRTYKKPEERIRKIKANSNPLRGGAHPRWIENRSLLVRRNRSDPQCIKWRTKVFTRDNFKCKIANQDCGGQLEAHHILPWRDYPELRYNINNGITLCHLHHPRKRVDEERLMPIFRDMVEVI